MDKKTSFSVLPIDSTWPVDGVNAISTKGIKHTKPAAYLAELIMIQRDPSLAGTDRFWKDKALAKSYSGFVIQISKRLKYCDFKHLHNAIIRNNLTHFNDQADELIAAEIVKEV